MNGSIAGRAIMIGLLFALSPGRAGEATVPPVIVPPVIVPPVTALAFAPDGEVLLVGSQAGLEIRAWPGLETKRKLETSLAHINDLAFSPNGRTFLAVGGTPSEVGAVELRSWPGGELVYERSPHDDLIYRVAWHPDSESYTCVSHDNSVGIFEASSGEEIRRIEGHSRPVRAVSYTSDGKTLVTAGVDRSLRVWRADTGERIRILDNHTDIVNDMALRPQASDSLPMLVSIGEDRTVRLWQPTIGRMVRFLRLPVKPQAVAWSRDGKRVLVVSNDGTVSIVDPDTVQLIKTIQAIEGWAYSMAVHPKDDVVLVGGENGLVRKVKV